MGKRTAHPLRPLGAVLAVLMLVLVLPAPAQAAEDGWIDLIGPDFDQNWTTDIYRQKRKFRRRYRLEPDGTLRIPDPGHGKLHLYYVGPVENANFKDFDLKLEAMLEPGASGALYFHTAVPKRGFPKKGLEIKLSNTHWQRWKTGSIHAGELPGSTTVSESPVKDGEWFELHLTVRGKRIISRINGEVLVDYTEPPHLSEFTGGTFALQQHTKGISFRNLRVKPLHD